MENIKLRRECFVKSRREEIDGKVFLLAFKPPRKEQVSDFN
jgi:hypothetical protein